MGGSLREGATLFTAARIHIGCEGPRRNPPRLELLVITPVIANYFAITGAEEIAVFWFNWPSACDYYWHGQRTCSWLSRRRSLRALLRS